MSKIDTILFDWDGTLAQTLEVWLITFQKAFKKCGVELTDSQIGHSFGDLKAHTKLGVTPDNEPLFMAEVAQVYDLLQHISLYDGAYEVLGQLKERGFKLGLVSTSNRRMLDTALDSNNLSTVFDAIVSQEDTVNHKPDPEPLLVALTSLGSSVDSTIFVGDSNKDTGAASNAAMDLLLFAPDTHKIYYDLEQLKTESSVKASFDNWNNFPFEVIG